MPNPGERLTAIALAVIAAFGALTAAGTAFVVDRLVAWWERRP